MDAVFELVEKHPVDNSPWPETTKDVLGYLNVAIVKTSEGKLCPRYTTGLGNLDDVDEAIHTTVRHIVRWFIEVVQKDIPAFIAKRSQESV